MSKKKLFALVLGACLLVSGTAYALTSSDFASIANTWVSTNCNGANPKYKQRATICYLFHKSNEQQTDISAANTTNINQQAQIDNLTSRKQVKVYTNSGTYLGLLLSPYHQNKTEVELFDTSLHKIVLVRSRDAQAGGVGWTINASYTGPNCTGGAYLKTNGDQYLLNTLNDRLLTETGLNKFWVFEDNPTIQYVQLKSLQNGTNCQDDDSLWPAIKLNSVTPTYPAQVPMPLDYRYE